MNIVRDLDKSRPFLSSSPTNGLETIRENWIANNPYDLNYGDLHFYDYTMNGWYPSSFPLPRFMSEFGIQVIILVFINWLKRGHLIE
jgi:beta-mannosidase